MYGECVVPCTFDPPYDAYAATAGAGNGEIYLTAYKYVDQLLGKPAVVTTAFAPTGSSPYSLDL